MLFETAFKVVPAAVTPKLGKGALGTWRSRGGAWTQCQEKPTPEAGTSPIGKPTVAGVYVGQHLSLAAVGKAAGGKAKVRTGLGKSDRPGS